MINNSNQPKTLSRHQCHADHRAHHHPAQRLPPSTIVGGVREDQSWLFGIGVRYLTGGSDVGYILSAGRADVRQLRAVQLARA
jgi:hypothetical protein